MTNRYDAVAFIFGLLIFSVGLSLAWYPLGPIGGGLVLMAVSVFGPRVNVRQS